MVPIEIMKITKFVFIVFFQFCSILSVAQENKFSISKPSAWIEKIIPNYSDTIPENDVNYGAYYILVDRQINQMTKEFYFHYAIKIVSESGLDDQSEIDIDYDPSYESLTVHSISIVRENAHIDKTNSEFKFLQREESLDRKIYDGSIDAVSFIEDIRVGDIIEFSYTLKGTNPILKGHFLSSFGMDFSTGIVSFKHRIVTAPDKVIFIKNHNTNTEHERILKNGLINYYWSMTNLDYILADSDVPDWYDPYPWVQISDFSSWNTVIQWAQELFEFDRNSAPDFNKLVSQIKKEKSVEHQIEKAIHFVQDDIRYLSISNEINSFKPNSPQKVIKQRFGDCKDKAFLLVELLKGLNIEAYPVLLHTERKQSLKDYQPTAYCFNHAAVQFIYHDTTYWIDATISGQRGNFRNIFFPDYRYGLVIDKKQDSLVQINRSNQGESKTSVVEMFSIPDYSSPVEFTVTTTYTGYEADVMRWKIADISRKKLNKLYLEYYSKNYPEIKLKKPFLFKDNQADNIITTTEYYSIENFWDTKQLEKNNSATFHAELLNDRISKPISKQRTMPLLIDHPVNLSIHTEINLPQDWKDGTDQIDIDEPYLKYRYRKLCSGNKIELDYLYQTKKDHIESDEIQKYVGNINLIYDYMGYEIYTFDSYDGSEIDSDWRKIGISIFILGVVLFAIFRIYREKK